MPCGARNARRIMVLRICSKRRGAPNRAPSRRGSMSEQVYEVPAEWSKRAYIDDAKYAAMYERSIKDPAGFWAAEGKRIDWFQPFTQVKNTSSDLHHVSIKWFQDLVTNVAHN